MTERPNTTNLDLDHDAVYEAITEGVREAVGLLDLATVELAIREGVRQAMVERP